LLLLFLLRLEMFRAGICLGIWRADGGMRIHGVRLRRKWSDDSRLGLVVAIRRTGRPALEQYLRQALLRLSVRSVR
jgi:hypothetical protein